MQHYFVKNNITALRRLRKTDNNRIARATGATIVNRVEEIKESDLGTKCGLFEVRKIGDEYVLPSSFLNTPRSWSMRSDVYVWSNMILGDFIFK